MKEPLDLTADYTAGDYVYKMGGDGSILVNGKKQIDCSHMVNLLLKRAGYNIPYEDTRVMNNSTYYTTVLPQDVKRGDIALWINASSNQGGSPLFHTGIIEDFNPATNAGHFFGAQTSTGPAKAVFGPRPPSFYWPVATKFLRAKEEFRTGSTPAASPEPAAPAPSAAAPAPLINFQYPFRKSDGKQFTDAEDIYKALERETSGHYLLGGNKFWHGGIHITDKSAPQCVRNEPIRCIADGEVVAYRLNQDYLESTFGDNEKRLKYTNSFCLVRHDYKSPANIEVTPNAHNELTFYSLYMHLLPYQRYLPEYDEIPPPRVKMVASGFMARSGIRDAINCEEYGAISAGAEIDILEEHPDRVHARGRLVKGVVTGRTENQEFWFAYKKDGNAYPRPHGEPSWKEVIPSERTRPGYWAGKVRAVVTGTGLTLREPPATLAHGAQAGMPIKAISRGISENLVLCTTSTIEFDSGKILNLRLGNKTLRMAECTFVPSTSGVATGLKAHSLPVPSSFWACVEDISPNRYVQWHGLIPSVFDEVVFTQTAIKAGDPMGYLGLMENLTSENGGVSSKYQVHVEVFTDEAGVKDFLKNAAGLKVGKQYLHLPVGSVIKSKAPATHLIRLNKAHSVDLSRATVVKKGNEDWYDVSVVEDGETVAGLVRKAGADIITQHDWEKLGFQIVEENNTTADGFLNPDDMSQFFKDLFTKIDKNHDGDIDPGELAEALKNADTRDQWAKLIAYHPTEWKDKADTAKWNRLNTLLESSPKTLVHEKERIDKFVFWDELLEKAVVRSSFIWHFHPISFIDNHLAQDGDDDLKWLTVERGQLTFDVEGNDIENPSDSLHRYFSRKVHWPGGASGITIGRGYDLGQRPNPEVDLAAVNIVEPLLSWLIGAKGLKGQAARDYLVSATAEIKTTFITRRQQHNLFVPVYEYMKARVIGISGQYDNIETYGSLNWESVDSKIQDVVIDLIYRGDYTPRSRELLQQYFVGNNYDSFTAVIGDSASWANVPADRFNKRIEYLRK